MSDQYDFCRRLGSSSYDLAMCLSIETREYESWSQGTQPGQILEWLKIRNKLQELEPALNKINREDLVDLAQSLCKIHNNNVNISVEKNNQESKVEELDGTNCFISESSPEDFAVDLKNADLVPSSELNPDLQSQESMPPEETVEKVEEEYADTPIEKMRETDDGQPTLFALWEIALKRSLDGGVDTKAEYFLNRRYSQSKQAKSGLTEIQKKLWDTYQDTEIEMSKQAFHSNLNIVISAPTSSGKSTLAEIFLAIPSFRHTTRKCAIYIAPTRALTQAKYRELEILFKDYEHKIGKIVLSTGEDIAEDWRINSGNFFIACMVYEKANILFSQKPQLLDRLGCIVVDEMHMIADLERGPVLEMVVTKVLYQQSTSDTTTKHSSSNEAMRIVLISTEEQPKQEVKDFLAVRQQNGLWEPPLCFFDDNREVWVNHVLVLASGQRENIEKSYVQFTFLKFKGSQQRQLSETEIKDIDKNLFKISQKSPAKSSSNKGNQGEFDKRLIKLIIDLLCEQPEGYRILVFVRGRQEAEDRASTLKNELTKNSRDKNYEFLGGKERHREVAEKFSEMLLTAEDSRMAKRLRDCIEVGIFIHHSDIERKIRTTIEEICSEVSSGMPSQVIFATETLSYGINLAVQDVILHGVEFYSQDRFGEFRSEQLSTSSYHNMIGRAGRKGKFSSGQAHVYILVPQDSEPIDIVRSYYKTIDPVDSKLYVIDDKKVQWNARDRFAIFGGATQEPSLSAKYDSLNASDFSYPFARSVLDALRHLNIQNGQNNREKVTQKTLMNLLIRTLYAKKHLLSGTEEAKKEELDLFTGAIQRILEDCSTDKLELIEKTTGDTDNRYQITALGEAIIDTGTEISTVGELLKIVKLIHSVWDTFSHSNHEDLPIELYLLCIIAQKEVFRDYIRFVPECKPKKDRKKWSDTLAKENTLQVDLLLKAYLSEIPKIGLSDEQISALIHQLRVDILNPWDALRKIEDNYEFGASDSILRLLSGILGWIAGEDRNVVYDLIEGNKLPEGKRGNMQKLRHFTEVLSFKILFLSKMLAKSSTRQTASKNESGIESEIESERDLRILALRLRFGCTSKAVPFFKPSSSTSISRREAKRILEKGITPHSLLAIADPAKYSKDLGILSKTLKQLKKDLEKDAENSFDRLVNDLTEVINEDDQLRTQVQNLVKEMPSIFSRSVENFTKQIEESQQTFDNYLRDQLDFPKHLDGGDGVLTSAGQEVRFNRYEVRINIPSEQIGIEWSGHLAERSQPDEESDEDQVPQYVEQHRINLVGIQFNHAWACQINPANSDFIEFLKKHENTKHLAIVPLPWIPSGEYLPQKAHEFLALRLERKNTTTFITPAAFSAMLVFLVRKFDNLQYYAEDFTKLLVQPISGSNFNIVTVEDVRRVMRQRQTDAPDDIMQALLEHFEADGDL
jgi:superfamily II DNA/RNA helicase